MNQVNSTEGATSGYGASTTESTANITPPETPGNSGSTTQNTTDQQGTPNAATTGQGESQPPATPPVAEAQVNTSGYGTEVEMKVEEPAPIVVAGTEIKPPETKTDTKVEDLKIDLRGLPEEQTKDIIEFAKEAKLTEAQAQAILDKRKGELDKYFESEKEFKAEVAKTYNKWEGDLRTDWGTDYPANIKAVNNTLTKHFPETAKLLASSGKRMNPMQMKEFYALSKVLGDEGSFEAGSTTISRKDRHPSDYYSN